MQTEQVREIMDNATVAVAEPNNHTIEKDITGEGHNKEMTDK